MKNRLYEDFLLAVVADLDDQAVAVVQCDHCSGGSMSVAAVVEMEVEQQTNGHDCGVFLLLNALRVAELLKDNGDFATSLPPAASVCRRRCPAARYCLRCPALA